MFGPIIAPFRASGATIEREMLRSRAGIIAGLPGLRGPDGPHPAPCDIRSIKVTDSPSKSPAAIESAPESPAAVDAKPQHDDIALIHGKTEDGRGLKILRRRKDCIEAGAVMPLLPGKPIVGEVVRLEPRKDFPLLCDVHVEYSPPVELRPTTTGPAQVATDRYRQNWDLVFGGVPKDESVLN
jgi:hypothetical protein